MQIVFILLGFFIKGFSHRYGDCPGHNIAHYVRTNLAYCSRHCRRLPNCRTFLFVSRGTSSYCWLKNVRCKRLISTRVRRYHFYTKRGGTHPFRFWRLLRLNFRNGKSIIIPKYCTCCLLQHHLSSDANR
jgi:hypothetical protein